MVEPKDLEKIIEELSPYMYSLSFFNAIAYFEQEFRNITYKDFLKCITIIDHYSDHDEMKGGLYHVVGWIITIWIINDYGVVR